MDENPVIKKSDKEQGNKEINFTELESQCISQLMQNKTPVNIGLALGVSQNTVRFYLINAGQKLHSIGKNREK